MDWVGILNRIASGEDTWTEFKRGLGNWSAIGKTLCAFANGSGGLLVLGVEDYGDVSGVGENPEKVQERLTSFLHAGCNNPITAVCDRRLTDEGKWIHWVEVHRQRRGLEPFSREGRYWIRRGRSTVAPSPAELQALFNSFGFVLTEEQMVASAKPTDIDLDAFRSFMKDQGIYIEPESDVSMDDDLRNAWVCADLDGVLRPTLYGLMVFGRDPQGHPRTSSMFVQCSAYDAIDRSSEVLSVAEAKGRLDEQVERAVGWFQSLGRKEEYRGLYRTDLFSVPIEVLREALVNAVIHRDYAISGSRVQLEVFANRIDITSPGALPNHMTEQQARSGGAPRSRNEMMANAMIVRRLMERRGRGWPLMRRRMREYAGIEPELHNYQDGGYVRVTIRFDPEGMG